MLRGEPQTTWRPRSRLRAALRSSTRATWSWRWGVVHINSAVHGGRNRCGAGGGPPCTAGRLCMAADDVMKDSDAVEIDDDSADIEEE